MNQKIKTYVNLAIKSGQVVRGTDKILQLKRAEIIILSPSLSENAKSKIEKNIKTTILTIGDVLPDNCLALAILNNSLSQAIISEWRKQEE